LSKTELYNDFHIDEHGWCTAYETGDLVIVNDNKLGIVMNKVVSKQKTMFPFVKVLLLEDNHIYDYGLNSLEIVSKV